MLLHEEKNTSHNLIRHYTPGKIVINEVTYTQSLILTPTQLIDHWPVHTFAELTAEHFAIVCQQQPEVVLLGTGEKHHFPAAAVMAKLIEKNIGFEVMTTGAACRTYNVLVSEGRYVVAALLIA